MPLHQRHPPPIAAQREVPAMLQVQVRQTLAMPAEPETRATRAMVVMLAKE